MKYLLTISAAVGLIAYHNAWQTIECPLLIIMAVLVCIIIKTKSNEQRQKKGSERSH